VRRRTANASRTVAEVTDTERPGAAEWVPEGADVEALRRAAPQCRGCELWEPASQVVFSAGADDGRIALVGEQPGDSEDRVGVPFVGPAGKLLQKAVDEAGMDRSQVYVTNAVKHFRFTQQAPGKRRMHQTPDLAHMTACRPWLVAELVAVDPEVVVCLGASAAKTLLGHDFRVTRQRGQVIERTTSVGVRRFVATIHPSAVLRVPADDREPAYQGLVADLRVAVGALTG
jgi:DNA polymerase